MGESAPTANVQVVKFFHPRARPTGAELYDEALLALNSGTDPAVVRTTIVFLFGWSVIRKLFYFGDHEIEYTSNAPFQLKVIGCHIVINPRRVSPQRPHAAVRAAGLCRAGHSVRLGLHAAVLPVRSLRQSGR